ncbi:hypothetical protein [Candidatus Xianfuyuplasma coldseepsis]|uniref:Lipoprotein n=1 Tax=Candidatus Xianfuyuplasma coldseepsis TaxID=2782163 RepID=A0A7L7KRS7_9MOLU|nr:hypothetical protein [Xianfuyuplasma coldseepsis]QMS85119.1 hypothetical protein G4Z02_04960 [Xianfuyuplasma coldseepsis]
MNKTVYLLMVVLAILMSSCSSSNNSNDERLSAYEQLNTEEQHYFDLFIVHLTSFKNPSSVRLVSPISFGRNDNDFLWAVVSAENSFGGTGTECYSISTDNIHTLDVSPVSECTIQDDDLSVGKLNEALKEYYYEQGWN